MRRAGDGRYERYCGHFLVVPTAETSPDVISVLLLIRIRSIDRQCRKDRRYTALSALLWLPAPLYELSA